MSRASRIRTIAAAATWLLLAGAGLLYSPTVSAQTGCSATYDATKYLCAPVQISDWRWSVTTAGGATLGPFETEAEAVAAVPPTQVSNSPTSWCTMTPTRVDHDTVAPS